ncbi:MAG: hypothetical protein J3K34DRAFT_156372 [Monoraphidium minutum]|nr:MAG: hypothetical protein J3K34DRAFT_156372 [Monoraphidium minutum]
MQRKCGSAAIAAALAHAQAAGAGFRGATSACVTAAAAASVPRAPRQSRAAPPPHPWAWQPWPARPFSSASGGGAGGTGGGGGPAAADADAAVARMMTMMEAMLGDPSTQQLLLSRMPPHMRRPEVIKAMMANPEVRQRMASLAQQAGLANMMGGMEADRMTAGIDAARKAGMDPGTLFGRFMASPSLAAKLKDPRVVAALMEVVANGPKALEKYSGDKAIVEAWVEAAEIMEQLQGAAGEAQQQAQPGGGGGGAAARGAASEVEEGMARVQAALGVSPAELMARAMARPELLRRVQDPEMQAALMEITQKPWKVVKYLLSPKVMGALKVRRAVCARVCVGGAQRGAARTHACMRECLHVCG